MINVIVPLDFSETSFNAAEYAADMFADRKDVNVILYHYYATGEDQTNAQKFLNSLKDKLSPRLSHIEIALESGANFIDSLSAFSHVKRAYMIVMGLTGKTPLAQRFSGSNTIKLSERNGCPLLVVPPDAVFNKISNVLIASEMRAVEETPALLAVKRVLHDFKPALHILNVDSSHYISLTETFKQERDKMESLLAEFRPEFYFMRLFDFHESINLFARDKHIDMIIIAPKHHSFYEKLFKTMHTKAMIYQSKVPVLVVHE